MIKKPHAKLFVFDIGNTLLVKPDTRIIDSAVTALLALREYGCILGVASMRNSSQLDDLNEQFVFDFQIGLNGSYVRCGDRLLTDEPLPEETVNGLGVFLDNYSIRHRCHGRDIISDSFPRNPVYVVEMFDMYKHLGELQKEFPELNFCIWEKGRSCDAFSKEWTKSIALREVCDYYNVTLKQTVGFGDGFNDEDLLKLCGKSVAMGTAPGQLKNVATFVTRPAGEDGVLWALENYEI